MTTFVLLPGSAGDGAPLWAPVRRRLEAAGHDSRALPAWTTVGSLGAQVSRALEEVLGRPGCVLVGYSYSGLVATAAARRSRPALRHLVLVDGLLSHVAPGLDAFARLVPPVVRRLVGDDGALLYEGTAAADPARDVVGTYVACTARPTKPMFAAIAASEACARRLGWQVAQPATGHAPMRDDPDRLAALLLAIDGSEPAPHGGPE